MLRTVARLDGTPFPSTARLRRRWVRGRVPALPERGPRGRRGLETRVLRRGGRGDLRGDGAAAAPAGGPNWYDPGRFWSGDDLELAGGARLGDEIAVTVPAAAPARP